MKKKIRIPNTDSISELADFFQKHSSTDLDVEFVEVTDLEFATSKVFRVLLGEKQAEALRDLARRKRIAPENLIRKWIRLHVEAERDVKSRSPARPSARANGKKRTA